MLASGNLERRLASSEIVVRLSILIITDGLDIIPRAMNKGVDLFAGSGQASLLHYAFTVSAIPALWFGIVVLGQEVCVPVFILSQAQRGQTQTQHEDQQQGAQQYHHLFQQRLLGLGTSLQKRAGPWKEQLLFFTRFFLPVKTLGSR